MEALLAHFTFTPHGDALAMTILLLVALIVPFIILGFVCWIFWKAKKREDAEKELEWRNARLS